MKSPHRHAVVVGLLALGLAVPAVAQAQHGAGAATREDADHVAQVPRTAWLQQDPADSIYRAARAALNRREYREAARTFGQLRQRYPRSGYVASSYYWEAFARNRLGTNTERRDALRLLETMIEQYPDDQVVPDARELATQIRGQLARGGDAQAAEQVMLAAEQAAAAADQVAAAADQAAMAAEGRRAHPQDEDIRIAALNALLNMDSDRAMPLLQRIMERRDPGSEELRRRAVFLVSQQDTEAAADVLLDAAQNDPDAEVRSQAVFWLSQVDDERSVTALEHILDTSTDPEVQQNAIFSLSQIDAGRAGEVVRSYAERDDATPEAREAAIFWLGQSRENAQYLQGLYSRLQNTDLRERILFSIAQTENVASREWLIGRALDPNENMDLRKSALFWAGQSDRLPLSRLAALYDSVADPEIKEQLIFVYSQHDSREAVDKLMDIARNDENADLRQKAIFWLSQSDDPRIADFLMEIIGQ